MNTIDKLQSIVHKDAVETRAWIKERNKNRQARRASQKIALQIRKRMEELNWSLDNLTEKMRVEEEQVNKWLTGKYDFSLNTILWLSEVLKIDLITIKSPS